MRMVYTGRVSRNSTKYAGILLSKQLAGKGNEFLSPLGTNSDSAVEYYYRALHSAHIAACTATQNVGVAHIATYCVLSD